MSTRMMCLLTVAGVLCLSPAFIGSTTVHADDWDDRWEDYRDAREDYWEDREDYYEDLYDDDRRFRRVRYRTDYPAYGWSGRNVRYSYRAPRVIYQRGYVQGYQPVGTTYHGHEYCRY